MGTREALAVCLLAALACWAMTGKCEPEESDRAAWPAAARSPFRWRWTIPLVGALLILSDALYFRAVALPGADISLVSVFRRTSSVVSFLVGGILFRDLALRRKALALLLVLVGAALAALG